MSLIVMAFYWAVIPYLGLRVTRWLWRRAGTPRLKAAVAVASAAGFAGLIWMLAGQKLYYDLQVKRLCAIDGGVKVYETVRLPAERFDKYGNVRIPAKKDAKPWDEYYYEWDIRYLERGNPELRRDHFKFYHVKDGKLLGEDVSYARRGGDFPGPWHESSFRCPSIAHESGIEKQIFLRGDSK